MVPAGVDLGLCSGSRTSSPSPVRIRSVLKKEAVCGGRAGGWLSVGEWRTSLWEGPRDRGGCNQRGPWEEEAISEIRRRKDGKEETEKILDS